jgi:hypothetical protein
MGKVAYGNKLYNKSYIKSGMRFRSQEISRLYIKNHIYTKLTRRKIFLIRCTWLYLFPRSPILRKIRRIKKHAEKWSEATSINQKRNAPLLYGNF